ncbi:hypothetical protein T440DRAFT_29830 [Plenodomus tracheiphilus IPT5]|uniref:Uncharacterized protein n=1 Tax=Plenodomus tracheiphilus IPT5 TaxID=1408161 RepID=A0A6A7BAX7_9PLEO|nr:hypothetical protein T440DRAFT_29830 [Plenodomus tracheiphilus IPT5]
MATRDPNFWKRFSIAVHQDDLEKSEMSQQKSNTSELKPSYVSSSHLSSAPTSPASHTSQPTPTSPKSPTDLFSTTPPSLALSLPAPITSTPQTTLETPPPTAQTPQTQPQPQPQKRTKLQKSPSQKTLLRPTLPSPPKTPSSQKETSIYHTTSITKTTTTTTTKPTTKTKKTTIHTLTHLKPPYKTQQNISNISLNLYPNRSPSRFKFWTTIEANPPSPSDSWLVAQNRKKRQRTWMCWVFWGVLGGVVAGVVVAIVVLKERGIL